MTIRGGGDPSQAWLPRRLREWARRPRNPAVDAHGRIMVRSPPDPRIQDCRRDILHPNGGFPSDHLSKRDCHD